MKITFVICLHSTRINNLKQVLRFLEKREPNLYGSQIVIVLHDKLDEIITSTMFDIQQFNLNLQIYNKALMCNYAIKMAKHEIIVILDSDRILPKDYFYINAVKIKKNQFITTKFLRECIKDYTDIELDKNLFDYIYEERCPDNRINRKNLFSGNVMFFKTVYQEIGGMDESFVGYSFNDNDITQKIITKKCFLCEFNNDIEIHLFHKKEFFYETKNFTKDEKEVHCVSNMLKYCNKWNLEINQRYKEAKEYIIVANRIKNEEIKNRFFSEFNKLKLNIFV